MDHTEIVESSPVLVISLPRLNWNRRMTQRTKNRTKINPGGNLRLRTQGNNFVHYRLHAAIEHLGI